MDWMRMIMLKISGVPELLDNVGQNIRRSATGPQRAAPASEQQGDQLRDQLAVITGGNAGVGLSTAKAFRRRGADVILACRSAERGLAAVKEVQAVLPGRSTEYGGSNSSCSHAAPTVTFERLDLASLADVKRFVRRLPRPPDLIVANAGIMAPETRMETPDGLEQQFQVNYLSHWLLAHELLLAPPQRGRRRAAQQNGRAGGARLLMLTSLTHRGGCLDFDDLQAQRRYNPLKAYADSKLAIVMAAREFQRRFDSAGSGNIAVAVDPGVLDTALAKDYFRSQVPRLLRAVLRRPFEALLPWILLPPASAADTVLWATTAPAEQVKGQFVKGSRVAKASRKADDKATSERLWDVSCQLTAASVAGSSASSGCDATATDPHANHPHAA